MIPIVRLSGSPKELGRQHGEQLAGPIRQMRRGLLNYLARISLFAGALPLLWLFQGLGRRFWPQIPQPLQEELRALAQGAHLSLAAVLLLNVADDLANNSPRCSALAVGGERTGGPFIMGRNLDYPVFTDILTPLQTLLVMTPDRGQPLASLAWPGYIGVCTGMNRAGVALAQLSSMSRDRSLKGVPAALRFRLGLQAGADAASVAREVTARPGTIGNNLMLCDPEAALVVEISARHHARRRPQAGVLTVTNHYQSPDMARFKGRFPPRPPLSVLSPYHFTEAYSVARNQRLQQLAQGRGLDVGHVQAFLADLKVANAGTVVCTVFEPSRGIIWVAGGAAPPVNHGPFAEIRPWA